MRKGRRRFAVGFQHVAGIIIGGVVTQALIFAAFGPVSEFVSGIVWVVWVHVLILLIIREQSQKKNGGEAFDIAEYNESERRDRFWLTLLLGGWIGISFFLSIVGIYQSSLAMMLIGATAISIPLFFIFIHKKDTKIVLYFERLDSFWKTEKGKRTQNWLLTPALIVFLIWLFLYTST